MCAPTMVSSGLLFHIGGWENTGGGKLSSLVVWLIRNPAPDSATQVNRPESSFLTSMMIRDWLLLEITNNLEAAFGVKGLVTCRG